MKRKSYNCYDSSMEILIKQIMDEKGIKVDRMVDQLEMSRTTVYRILQGKRVINVNELERFAKVLEVDIEDLYRSKYSKMHKMSQI